MRQQLGLTRSSFELASRHVPCPKCKELTSEDQLLPIEIPIILRQHGVPERAITQMFEVGFYSDVAIADLEDLLLFLSPL